MLRRKILLILGALLVLCQSCGEQDFGFSKNPLNLLVEIGKSLTKSSTAPELSGQLGQGALCIWSRPENIELLRKSLPYGKNDLTVEHQQVSSNRNDEPLFVGFWSYFTDIHQLRIIEKRSRVVVLEALSECNFGADGVKRDKDRGGRKMDYPRKECRIVQITPRTFQAPPVPEECELFSQPL